MKRRIAAFALAVVMTVGLWVPASAAGSATVNFADIRDSGTALAVESLRLLGVLDGYGDGTFRPDTVLNRAQFCKMAVYALNGEGELGRYKTVTVFPDVKPSHWAAAYINMAAKGKNIISGYVDGRFHPDQTVTVGHAVTILMRMLGYKDENVGGIWPHSYMAEAASIGLTDGVNTDPYAGLTRGQAAQLFLNLLRADMVEGGSYITAGLKATAVTDAMLVSSDATGSDGRANALQLANGSVYSLRSGKASNGSLNGTKGTLVVDSQGMALTFVPDDMGGSKTVTLSSAKATEITDISGVKYTVKSGIDAYYQGEQKAWSEVYAWLNPGSSVTLYLNAAGVVEYVFVGGGGNSNAAIIVYDKGSTEGFDSLTHGSTTYKLYKNGAPATAGDMRPYDVAIYSSATNSIRVTDTKLTVFYENCKPNPQEPAEITAFGQQFEVLPTGMDSVAKFKPGDRMTLLLTEDNKVAGALEARGDVAMSSAVGIVEEISSGSAKVNLLCGLTLSGSGSFTAREVESLGGQLVRVSSGQKGGIALTRLTGGAGGDLDVAAQTLGSRDLAPNVMIFRNGPDGMEAVNLTQLNRGTIPANEIGYARTDWRDRVDLIVLGSAVGSTYIYGLAQFESGDTVTTDPETGEETESHGNNKLTVLQGNGKSYGPLETGYECYNGEVIGITVTGAGSYRHIAALVRLQELSDVPNLAWTGRSAVTVGGRTYPVPADVICFNRHTQDWMTLDEAHAYASTADLYIHNGMVRVIKVG